MKNVIHIDTCKSYLIKEDSIISNSVMYFATKESDLVRTVSIDWNYETNLLNNNVENIAQKSFEQKTKFLIDFFTQKAGKAIRQEMTNDYLEFIWKTANGLTIELNNGKKNIGIRLVIYKN